MCAINVRAYSAAYVIWMAIEFLQRDVATGVMGEPYVIRLCVLFISFCYSDCKVQRRILRNGIAR